MTGDIFKDFETNKEYTIQRLDGISSAVSLFTVSTEVSFQHFNATADALLGYEKGGLLQLTAEDSMAIFHPDHVDSLFGSLIATMRDGGFFHYDCRLLCADGSYKWVNISAQLIRQDGGTLYFHGVLTAIPEPGNIRLKGLHVLIAAGQEEDRQTLSHIIEAAGGSCDVFVHGMEALESFESSSGGFYQCIIIGSRMKDVNSIELAKDLRISGHSQAEAIPLLMASSKQLDVPAEIGISGFIYKPLTEERVMETLTALLPNNK